MENNVIEPATEVVRADGISDGETRVVNKRPNRRTKMIVGVVFAAIITFLGFFFLPQLKRLSPIAEPPPTAVENPNVPTAKLPVAQIQVRYQKAFKHLKRMEVYYREARDLLLELRYEEVVKKCDSALLCKTEKPQNWTSQKWGDVYNIQAESLLYLGKIPQAEAAAQNALKLDKLDKLGYLHLIYAQIIAAKEKKATPLFLVNFTFALKKRLPLWDYMELDGFDAVRTDPSVKKLLRQYQKE